MTYELLKIIPYSDAEGNIGWEDFDFVDEFSATRQSLRRRFADELKKRGVCISRREHKFEFYGVNYEKDIIYNMAVYVGDFANTFGIDYVYVTF